MYDATLNIVRTDNEYLTFETRDGLKQDVS